MRRSNIVLLSIIVLVCGYFAVAFSSLRLSIGRVSPPIAAWFSPFFFNFSGTYVTGKVLDFDVGMSRGDVFRVLNEKYAGVADLTAECKVTTASAVIPISKDLDIAAAYGGGPQLCTRLDSRRLSVDFEFKGEKLTKISMTFVTNELP